MYIKTIFPTLPISKLRQVKYQEPELSLVAVSFHQTMQCKPAAGSRNGREGTILRTRQVTSAVFVSQ